MHWRQGTVMVRNVSSSIARKYLASNKSSALLSFAQWSDEHRLFWHDEICLKLCETSAENSFIFLWCDSDELRIVLAANNCVIVQSNEVSILIVFGFVFSICDRTQNLRCAAC